MMTNRRLTGILEGRIWWVVLCLLSGAASAQNVITTFAGTEFVFGGNGKPAIQGQLGRVSSVAVDGAGNVYTGDVENHLVYRIGLDGILTVVAGNGIPGYTGDGGPATQASFAAPVCVAVGPQGDLYIADTVDQVVRRVDSAGMVSTVAGHGGSTGYGGDGGPALAASFFAIQSLAVGPDGAIYVADTGKVRKIQNGTIQVYAGNGTATGDGPAVGAALSAWGLAVDAAGNLFLTDTHNLLVRVVTPDGKLTTIAGGGTSILEGAPALQTQFRKPTGIALDPQGNIYVADAASAVVRRIGPDRTVYTVAGTRVAGFSGDGGAATSAGIGVTLGLAANASGLLYIADGDNLRVRRVGSDGTIQTIGGLGQSRYSGDGGPALNATLGTIGGTALDSMGNLYISDSTNHRVRKIGTDGIIRTVAGTGVAGDTGDEGPGTSATLLSPAGLATTPGGDLFIADRSPGSRRIRRLGADGIIHAAAGKVGAGNPAGFSTPIDARLVQIGDPVSIATDSAGDLFYLDPAYQAFMWEVLSNSLLAAFPCIVSEQCPAVIGLGVLVSSYYSLTVTSQLAIGKDHLAYLAVPTQGVFRIESDGTLTFLAGTGQNIPPFDGADGITFDNNGNVVFTNSFYVYRIGSTGVATLAGAGPFVTAQGDGGLATAAGMFPTSPVYDAQGNLFIADQVSQRVRQILAKPPSLQVQPTQLAITGLAGGAPAASQTFTVTSNVPGITFTVSASGPVGNWLSVSAPSGATPCLVNVTADPGNLSAGTYQGLITVFAPNAVPPNMVVNVILTVLPGSGPALSLDNQHLSFSFPKSGSPQAQKITVSNAGSGTLNFTASTAIATPAGGSWLSLSSASGQATPDSPFAMAVTADPTGLGPGTYTGTVILSGAGSTSTIPVTMTISPLNQVILLSQRGLSFTAVAQGGVVPPQTFAVRNAGTGVVPWTVSPSTLSGGQGWLLVTPTSGSSDAAQTPPAVAVSVNATGLAAGIYYGLVQVNAPAAANSPQVMTVFLQVLAAGSDAAAVLDQGSLLFTAVTGGGSPSSQTVSVYNITASAKSFRSAVSADPGLSVVTLPTDATLDPQNPTPIVVQPFTSGLASGVYNGTVTLQFSDGRVLRVNVKVIMSSTGGAGPSTGAAQRGALSRPLDASLCTPTKLVPALISLADSFELPTGLPVNLGVYVKDDCGNPVTTGSLTATFSTGGSAPLAPANGGLWQGQWLTQNGALSTATVKLHAQDAGLVGDQQVTGNLLALEQPPAFPENGIAADFGGSANAPIAPGSVISIYGSQLASDAAPTVGIPLPQQWLGTQVFISGGNNVLLPLPLYYVSPGQVNAIVPYEVQTDTPLQLLVERGTAASQPVSVNLAAGAPALYGGPAAVTDYPPSGAAPYTVTADTPAHAGDYLVFYGLGLGAVTPPVTDGGVPSGLSQVSGAQVQIGSQTVQPVFAGLTSQFPGLYQINVVIPPGTGTGSAVPLVVTVGGQSSLPITVAIQ